MTPEQQAAIKRAQQSDAIARAMAAETPTAEPQRNVIATTDDGGVIYETPDGKRGFTSPSYSTTDPERIDQILSGATPADASMSGFDQSTIAQNPITARVVKAVENVPFVGSYVDEAAGAIAHGVGTVLSGSQAGDKYGRNVKEGVRGISAAMSRERPKESLALGVGGAVAGSVPLAVAAAPTLINNAAATVGGRAIQAGAGGAVLGAVEGAVHGAGAGEEGTRLDTAQEGALVGGITGGALGVAAPYLAEGVKNALTKLRGSGVGAIKSALGVSTGAAKVIKNALDRGDMESAVAAIERGGDNAMLADAGQAGRELLDAAANSGGVAGQIARDAVESRTTAASADMQSSLDRYLGSASGKDSLVTGVRTGTAGARSEAYDAAYSAAIDYASPKGQMLEGLMDRVPESALRDAQELMRLEGVESAQNLFRVGDNGSISRETLPDVKQLHYILQALEGTAQKQDGKGVLGGTTPLGRATKGLARDIRNTLKGLVPEFAKAQDIAADAIAQTKAVDLGYSMFRSGTTRENVLDVVKDASKAEKDAVKQGLRSYIDDTLANVSRTVMDPNTDAREGVKLLRDISSRANATKLRMVLGKDASEKLAEELDTAATAFELRAAIAQNSKTAIRQEIQGSVKQQTTPGVLETLSQGEPVNAAKRFVQVFTGSSDEAVAIREMGIYEEIADALTGVRGSRARNALKFVKKAMDGEKITENQARFIGTVVAGSAFLPANRKAGQLLSTQ